MCLRSSSGIEAVDIGAAGVVDEVGFGTADKMSQLIMSAIVRVATPNAAAMV